MKPALEHYLVVGALLFVLGLFTAMTRRSAGGVLTGVQLLASGAALDLVAFHHFAGEPPGGGELLAVCVVALTAAQAAVTLAVAASPLGRRSLRPGRTSSPPPDA